MSSAHVHSETAIEPPRARTVDMKLEVASSLFRTSIALRAFTATSVGGAKLTPTSCLPAFFPLSGKVASRKVGTFKTNDAESPATRAIPWFSASYP